MPINKIVILEGLAAILLTMGASLACAESVTVSYLEGKAPIAPDAVTAYGEDLFGDRINLYNGALGFEHTDLSLPGPQGLPVKLTRSHSPGRSLPEQHGPVGAADGGRRVHLRCAR